MKNFNFKWLLLSIILSIASINTVWADTRLFTTGQKVFFQDATLSTLGNACWKSGEGGNVYAHFFNKKRDSGDDDETVWAEARLVYGSDGTAGAIYEFTVPELNGASASWWGVLFTRGTGTDWSSTWNQTTDQWPALENSLFTISNTKDGENWTGNWTVMPEMLCSNITSPEWSKEDGLFFTDYSGEKGIVKINCTASQSFQFIVFDGAYYKSYADETNTTWTDYGPKTDGGYNFQFTADEAGEYIFQWDKTNHKLWVWEPKARLTKQTYLYFDAGNSDADRWKVAAFGARYFYKYYDSGNDLLSGGTVDCTDPITGTWVYYTLVPNDDYAGQIMIERKDPTNMDGTRWNYTNTCSANTRDDKSQNCMFITSGQHNYWDTQDLDWKTYCPPKETSTISDNSTVKYTIDGAEDGSESHPFLVEKGTTIKVSSASTDYVSDGNMTTTYRFYDGSTALGTGTQEGTTYDYTASSTPNTVHKMKVNALNEYNGATSSDKFSSILYYKAVNCYTVTYYGNGNNSGNVPAGSGTKYAQGATITVASNSNSLGRSGYNFAGWNTAEHISGTDKAASSTISSIVADWSLYAKWTQSVTLDDNGGKGDGTGSVTMTYNCSTVPSITNPTRDGYTFAGWYEATDGDALVINTSGVLQAGTSYTDASGYWTVSGSAPTLHAHWTANQYAITLDDRGATTASSTSTTLMATYDSNTLTATITNPAKTGYTFAGWYVEYETGSGIGKKQVINTSGELVANVADYTDASANWIKAGTATLYARWKANANASAFNFQYAASGSPYYSSDWTVENFGDATDNMRTVDNFTMPDPSSKKFYVGWGGDFISSGLGSRSWSAETNLSDLHLYPSGKAIGTATGATGKLIMWDNSEESNVGVCFEPDGYGLTYAAGTIAFNSTTRENLYETNIVTLTSSDVAGTFTVKLKTSSSYTTCARSADEDAETVGDRTEKTLANGMTGRFQIWINNDGTNNNFYLMFVECEDYFWASDGNWSDDEKWSLGRRPTIDEAVYLQKAITVDIANAKAKSVVIDQKDGTGHLTIGAGKSLLIAGDLRKKNSSGTLVATEEEDVFIDSDLSNGNGALIMKTHDGTNKATVNFATKAYKKKGETKNWVNQYIGTPFNDQGDPTYNYYGMELYEFNASDQAWEEGLASSMTAFHGYDLLSDNATQNVVLNMSGTLVASNSQTPSQTVTNANDEVMFANSWVAPIDIASLNEGSIFTNAAKTIYIFNSGTVSDAEGAGTAGHYTTIPVNEIPSGYSTIPSMQAFSLYATAAGTVSLALDYNTHVYTPATSSVTIEPAHAPRRTTGIGEPVRTIVKVRGESGWGDNLRILEREDFSEDFDDGWEGQKLFGIPETPQLYAVNADRQMAVLAVQDVDNTVLGFQAGSADTQYTFSFEYDGEETLYLYDTKTEKETRITNDATYTFTTSDKAVHNRFVISKTAKIPTGVDNINDGVKARKLMIDGTLYIIRDGRIYNAEGSLVK